MRAAAGLPAGARSEVKGCPKEIPWQFVGRCAGVRLYATGCLDEGREVPRVTKLYSRTGARIGGPRRERHHEKDSKGLRPKCPLASRAPPGGPAPRLRS